jgi:hypothetical protein
MNKTTDTSASSNAAATAEWVAAARAVLATHDELRRVEDIGDGFELGADDLPADGSGWLAWHDEQYKPAHQDWIEAMDRLAAVLGEAFPGRHPSQFRPVCEQLTTAPDLLYLT